MMTTPCTHLDQINEHITPLSEGCETCQQHGGWWVRLRICLTCGHIGCCDDSPGKHASQHFHETGHPIMQSFEPGQEKMRWCFVDEIPV
jgi:uncharacterized UBP type Zn finger protein